jgi:8-oxo-dGTP diphosphatase
VCLSEPIPIAVAVVEHAGRVLIGKRPPGGPLGGFWEFPGGKVAPGETLQEAAARECREETGLIVSIGEPYLEVVHSYDHGRVRLCFFAAAPLNPVQAPAGAFRWVPVSDLADYTFPLANATLLELLLGAEGGAARENG